MTQIKYRHSATDSRGKVHRRTSVNHIYAYAVVAHYPAGQSRIDPNVTWPAKSEASWTTSMHYALQYARDRKRGGADVEILTAEVNNGSKQT